MLMFASGIGGSDVKLRQQLRIALASRSRTVCALTLPPAVSAGAQ